MSSVCVYYRPANTSDNYGIVVNKVCLSYVYCQWCVVELTLAVILWNASVLIAQVMSVVWLLIVCWPSGPA